MAGRECLKGSFTEQAKDGQGWELRDLCWSFVFVVGSSTMSWPFVFMTAPECQYPRANSRSE
jgi:hypothetical protein